MNKEKLLKGLKFFLNSFIWLGVLLLVADIITKNVVVQNADTTKSGVEIIPGFLRIQYLINPHVAFGLSTGSDVADKIIFSVVAIGVTIGIVIFLIKKWDKLNRLYRAAAMMIIAGALGNVFDRLFYSAEYLNFFDATQGKYITGVVDWIDFYGIWGFHFNVADSAVVIAAFMLIIYMIVEEVKEYIQKKKLEPKEEKSEKKEEKLLSQTELEKQRLLEEGKEKDE